MPIPDVLYHYTTQAGLLGIIQSKQIWATSVLFLNDTTEINYAIKLIQENTNKFCEERKLNQEETQFLEDFEKKTRRIFYNPGYQKNGGAYTCSFSENGDQLSQWRGYCPDGNGFSIGFDFASSLNSIIKNQGFELVKCEYDKLEQVEKINAFLDKVLKDFHESKDKATLDYRVWDVFFALAPTLKHPKFEEEREWRLISKPTPTTLGPDFNPKVNFRSGKSMLIPYLKINLVNKNSEPLNYLKCIPEIYVGPTLYPELSRISLSGFLLREDVHVEIETDVVTRVSKSEVHKTKIPYRI